MTKNFVDASTIIERNFAPQSTLADPARRALMAKTARLGAGLGFGLAGASLLGACHNDDDATTTADTTPIGDADILNFALNLEYLEAEFYLHAVTGSGLSADMTTGTGTQGGVTGGAAVTFTTAVVRQYAKEIALDEMRHVAFLRSALGASAVARPAIDIQNSFTTLFRAAGIIGGTDSFDPYANELNFLLSAFVFEDVGVTAYKGAAPLIATPAYLTAAAGILAAEAYHAGLIRTILYARGVDTSNAAYDQSILTKVGQLSDARDAVDGPVDDDQGIAPSGTAPNDMSNIVPTDANSIAYSRTTGEVLDVVFLNVARGAQTAGGFFPNGVNGRINTSTAN